MLALFMWVIYSQDVRLICWAILELVFILIFPIITMVILGKQMPRTVGAKKYLQEVGNMERSEFFSPIGTTSYRTYIPLPSTQDEYTTDDVVGTYFSDDDVLG